LNITQIDARDREIKARAAELKRRYKTVEAKGFPSAECSKLHKDIETLQEDSERLKWDRARADVKGLGYGNAAGGTEDVAGVTQGIGWEMFNSTDEDMEVLMPTDSYLPQGGTILVC